MSFLNSLFGSTEPHRQVVFTSTLDIVTYAAGLASNPNAIDHLLDTVRRVTSNLSPEQKISDADNQALIDVYLKLEAYLADREPLRSFSKNEMRTHMAAELRNQVDVYEAKHKLSAAVSIR